MWNSKNGIIDAKLFSYGQHTVSSFPKEYPQGFYFLFARMMLTLSLALNIVDMDIHHVHYCNGSLFALRHTLTWYFLCALRCHNEDD